MPADTDQHSPSAGDAFPSDEPFALFANWMKDAEEKELNDPNAMSLATVGPDGMPSVRMVLLKGVDPDGHSPRGFLFYTNLGSRKGQELVDHPMAALCFHWKSLRRQIRVEGMVQPVTDAEADEYFQSRARGSRIGAWASKQSQPLEGRWALEKRVALFTAKFGAGKVPRPDFWSGFRIVPRRIEFWHDREFRLHDRFVFEATEEGWNRLRLYP